MDSYVLIDRLIAQYVPHAKSDRDFAELTYQTQFRWTLEGTKCKKEVDPNQMVYFITEGERVLHVF